ncbi:Hypothetical predicted protein [Scomber scombrus]|uniref:Uncharacterized protein n=1 Tax=Scomber scombrus TaxID=13677 RepID=A0AAV1P0I8_SCOSC
MENKIDNWLRLFGSGCPVEFSCEQTKEIITMLACGRFLPPSPLWVYCCTLKPPVDHWNSVKQLVSVVWSASSYILKQAPLTPHVTESPLEIVSAAVIHRYQCRLKIFLLLLFPSALLPSDCQRK